jgi:hypothetical protein
MGMSKLELGLPASLVNAASAQLGTSPTRLLTTYYLGALLLVAVLAGVGSRVVHGIIARPSRAAARSSTWLVGSGCAVNAWQRTAWS